MDVDKPFRKLQKDVERELGEDYKFDDRKLYVLPSEEKYDVIPELINGKNVADFIDPEILEKLEELEREEELREAAGVYDEEIDDLDSEEEETKKLAEEYVQFVFVFLPLMYTGVFLVCAMHEKTLAPCH